MNNSLSLRGRLTLVILLPLILIATIIGAWAYFDAQKTAAERFDRSLLSTTLAISRDTAVSGGDALSEETRDLLRDTSGGAVFYHVYAPDGVFVTGYATPPVPPEQVPVDATQTYYDAVYQGAPVRALRFAQSTSIDGLTGLFTFTVWQNTAVRDGFVRTRTGPVFLIIASMIGALAIIVWFGVGRGLAPLIDLEDAIARRSVTDLSPIKRRIPQEVTGIVGRFNDLVDELSRALEAKNAFISDAAHQLRNPIAGVLSLAESVSNAKSLDDAHARAADLQEAARDAGQLANNLLTLDRAQASPIPGTDTPFDPRDILLDISHRSAARAVEAGIALHTDLATAPVQLRGDPVMFEQAVLNIINNAIVHGGPKLSQVLLTSRIEDTMLVVIVSDDGKGIAEADFDRARSRFSQVGPSAGSGLGLPIAAAVVDSFNGEIELAREGHRFQVTLSFPVQREL
ncbi:two-component system, OmpR family, sensor histidine kinase TctE [Cognatiyoonia koreensis]|uniref:histidine kinase n=1 Tax=Cognatiyoonia koreensis TaxID=364200 RepID=A0A1I0PUA4_9RHOB|nr:sensor histidine kinase [Cognatiyoonia koreensis]SEW17940.1 two-component system, OmpR family, sensor histidine kinase TctE [Cognatiyoonia koreensis]